MVIVRALVITSFLKQVQNVTRQLQLRQLPWDIWKLFLFCKAWLMSFDVSHDMSYVISRDMSCDMSRDMLRDMSHYMPRNMSPYMSPK